MDAVDHVEDGGKPEFVIAVVDTVVGAYQREGRCDVQSGVGDRLEVVCASQIEGRCNRQRWFLYGNIVVCASQIEGRCNSNNLNA